ncbi:uncharacterized protein LOC128961709 [Oppia nitens]|uniref:uncharacterized protein LOC128961709 n=1 Tax=Oppia nitens TaxID=1686743 RepID=UPI0023DAB847|nr:uncharacterized protein LOC128961709 [Oppia nitens]
MDIPGFYYDKQKKKYFRIGGAAASSGPSCVTSHEVNKRKKIDETLSTFKKCDQSVHLPQTLYKQEINFHTKYNLQEEVLRSHLKSIQTIATTQLEVIDFRGENMKNITVDALIGSPTDDQLFTVLTGDSGSVVYQIPVEDIFNDCKVDVWRQIIGAFPVRNRVIDIDYNKGVMSTLVHHHINSQMARTSYTLTTINGLDVHPVRSSFEFEGYLFSATHTDDSIILGDEKLIKFYNRENLVILTPIKTKNNVLVMKTSDDGKCLLSGSNKGQLCYYDIRDDYKKKTKPLMQTISNSKSIVFTSILSDKNTVIVSSHDHSLCRCDLRMFNKPIVKYSNHRNDCSKIEFSVDESAGVLCSSGDDCLVRFWSLQTGKLLHIINPFTDNEDQSIKNQLPSTRVCYSHSWKCLNKQFKALIYDF